MRGTVRPVQVAGRKATDCSLCAPPGRVQAVWILQDFRKSERKGVWEMERDFRDETLLSNPGRHSPSACGNNGTRMQPSCRHSTLTCSHLQSMGTR